MTDALRGNVRERGYRRLSHGLFLAEQAPQTPELDWRRTLRGWLLVLPDEVAYTGLTAARLRGWPTPPLPDWVPLFASVPLGARAPSRAGLVVSRLRRPENHTVELVHGLPVDAPAEVLLRCARELGILDLVPMIDAALHLGHVTRTDLRQLGDSRRPGCRLLRQAVALAHGKTESPWESVLRLFHEVLEVPVDVQVDIEDDAGTFVARADLLVRGTRFLHEYDGAVHRDGTQHADDLRRDRRIVRAGYVRRGFTAGDLLARAAATMFEIDAALHRPTQMVRLRRWRHHVGLSALSETGRERLRNRWVREMGLSDYLRQVS